MFESETFLDAEISFNLTNFNEKISVYNYQKFNNQEMIAFNYIGDDFDDGVELTCEAVIKDGCFENIICSMGEGVVTTNISYNVANEEIPSVPENVEFEVEASEVVSAYNKAIENLNNENEITINCIMSDSSVEDSDMSFSGYYNGEVFYTEDAASNNKRWIYENAEYEINRGFVRAKVSKTLKLGSFSSLVYAVYNSVLIFINFIGANIQIRNGFCNFSPK